MNFFSAIYQQLQLDANKEIITWPDGSKSTGQHLLHKISEIQASLPESGNTILIAQPFNFDTLCIILACIGNGNPVLIYAKNVGLKNYITYFKQYNIKHAFAKNILLRLYLSWKGIQTLSTKSTSIFKINIQEIENNHVALISFSSGSTGVNKSIERTHALLTEQVNAIQQTFKNWENKTDFPLFANILLYNLSIGKKTVIPAIKNFDLHYLDSDKIINQLVKENIETITGNEYYFNKICEALLLKKQNIKKIKGIGIGGSPISNLLIEKIRKCFPNATIKIIYGSTEAEPISIKTIEEELCPVYFGYNVGTVHPSIEIKIDKLFSTNIHGNDIEIGEITVKGKHVAIRANNDFLHTGDYGYLLNNELYLTARAGNTEQIKGLQHLQLEHCVSYNLKKSVAIKIIDGTIHLYSEHKIEIKEIEKIFFITFNSKLPIIIKHTKIHKDPRHMSKILYHKIK
jgi:acyl-CoA synthetase (AMP-forming)/AMP-acid ligase II